MDTSFYDDFFEKYNKVKQASSVIRENQHRKKIFNYYPLSNYSTSRNLNNFQQKTYFKQVVAKLLSNIGGAKNCQRALEYIKENANNDILGKNNYENTMAYISKHTPLLNEDNEIVNINDVMRDWIKDFSKAEKSKNVWHLMFSIKESPTQKNLNILKESVKETLQSNFFGYKYVMALHTHQNNPHIHIILNKRNIFTKKKIHFNSKQEISDFWNNIRNDFAMALNTRGLKYHNHSRLELDLQKEYQKIDSFKKDFKEELNNIFLETIKKEESLIANKNKDLELLLNDIEELRKKRVEFIKLMEQYKLKNNKRYFKTAKNIKELGKEIAKKEKSALNTIQIIETSTETIYTLKKNIEEKSLLKIDEIHKQKNFINFFKNKKGERITLSDYRNYKKVYAMLESNNKDLKESIINNIESSIILSNLPNKKETIFSLNKKLEILEKNIYLLKNSNAEFKDYENYYNRLQNNKVFIKEMMSKRFEDVRTLIKNGKNSDFLKKEYKKACEILNIESKAINTTNTANTKTKLSKYQAYLQSQKAKKGF